MIWGTSTGIALSACGLTVLAAFWMRRVSEDTLSSAAASQIDRFFLFCRSSIWDEVDVVVVKSRRV